MKKHIAKSLNFSWGEEAFALVPQHGIDGERVTREQQQKESDQREAAKQQLELKGTYER